MQSSHEVQSTAQTGDAVGVGVGGISLLDELWDIDLLELRLDELDTR